MAETPDTSMPESMLNARRLYKHSTADIIDWLCFTSSIKKKPAIQQSKKRRGKPRTQGDGATNGEKIMTVDEILSCANCIVNSKATRPRYIKWEFKTALFDRRRMTAWYRTREIEDSEDTRKHEHFTETLQQAFENLFPPSAEDGVVAPVSPSHHSSQSANTFGPLDGIPTDKESTLSETELQELLDSWATKTSKPRSRIADDHLDQAFQWYGYVMEMDLMVDTVSGYWRKVAKGEMSVPLAAWLTHVGYSGIKRLCEEHQNVHGMDHEKLVDYVTGRGAMQSAFGETFSKQDSDRAGIDLQYKEFTTGLALSKPILPLRRWKFPKQLERSNYRELCAASPFDFFLTRNEEAAGVLMDGAKDFLEPDEYDDTPEAMKELMHRDSAIIDSLVATMVFLEANPVAFGDRAA
ncbi:unnamed protein product [Zymoseptoria tritici ST99CH_1A5]|uniref:DUF6604 domain-containing protein n=3 Tax=Zymoseptoria tritici TaxID=1047171 RepID=A0A1X7RXP8_ZYMT9|nr:unnamed protein product [Zymoseptoria tritici ST99CH_3D7]SMR54973.1 unnamed protein product [Zymoseptoria tritici ST99CH_1E4]SMR57355.1 unnamed protein product [Zymoseptoria tritici ST99CH_3D1]SMY25796.1 unnamed protein product [Zymoseptoria tritici ST99CH_1A5]